MYIYTHTHPEPYVVVILRPLCQRANGQNRSAREADIWPLLRDRTKKQRKGFAFRLWVYKV